MSMSFGQFLKKFLKFMVVLTVITTAAVMALAGFVGFLGYKLITNQNVQQSVPQLPYGAPGIQQPGSQPTQDKTPSGQ